MEPKIRLSWIKGLGPFWALGFLLPVWDLGALSPGMPAGSAQQAEARRRMWGEGRGGRMPNWAVQDMAGLSGGVCLAPDHPCRGGSP